MDGELRPLSQMRSANKKAGNIGDVEVTVAGVPNKVIEAWDAKFGQPYLLDQLDELAEKIADRPELEVAGFVVDTAPRRPPDLEERIAEISDEFDIDIRIVSFDEWIGEERQRSRLDDLSIAQNWLTAYTESLSLRRLDMAPMDEPADQWVQDLSKILESTIQA